MQIELPSVEEIDQTEKNAFLDAVNGLVIKKFQENKNKNSIEISIDDIKNAATMEEINEDDIKSIRELFEQKGISVIFPYIEGESGEEYFQFTMPSEEAV